MTVKNKFLKVVICGEEGQGDVTCRLAIQRLFCVVEESDHYTLLMGHQCFAAKKGSLENWLRKESLTEYGFFKCQVAPRKGARGEVFDAWVNKDLISHVSGTQRLFGRPGRYDDGDIAITSVNGETLVVEYSDEIIRKLKVLMDVVNEDRHTLPVSA